MSLCINPRCSKPENLDSNRFCQSCGSELLLAGQYQVIRLLSNKGGFGHTYEVTGQDTPKVLKVLINTHYHAVELFQQEASVLQQLNHPGIPKGEKSFIYHPRNSETPLHCLIMEKVEGIDLEEYQKKNEYRAIEQPLVLDWLSQLVTILHEVHSRQFFHRDIKPSNIILKPDGQLVLIDFGAARQVTSTILAGGQNTGIYTPGYAPPEQQRGHSVPQSDFYALGRTFVFLLTGKEPNHPKIYDYQHNEFKWRQYANQIVPEFADFLDLLMAERVIDRPASTQVMVHQLEELKRNLSGSRQKTQKVGFVRQITKIIPLKKSATQSQSVTKTQATVQSKPPEIEKVISPNYAGFWLRFKASIIDSLVLLVVAAILGFYLSIKVEELQLLTKLGLNLTIDPVSFRTYAVGLAAIGTTTLGLVMAAYEIFILSKDYHNILAHPSDICILAALWVGIFLKWAYFTLFEYCFKGTFGKTLFDLRVTDLKGKRISLGKANWRYWTKVFSTVPLYLGFMLAGWTPRKRALHDLLAGTFVIRKNAK